MFNNKIRVREKSSGSPGMVRLGPGVREQLIARWVREDAVAKMQSARTAQAGQPSATPSKARSGLRLPGRLPEGHFLASGEDFMPFTPMTERIRLGSRNGLAMEVIKGIATVWCGADVHPEIRNNMVVYKVWFVDVSDPDHGALTVATGAPKPRILSKWIDNLDSSSKSETTGRFARELVGSGPYADSFVCRAARLEDKCEDSGQQGDFGVDGLTDMSLLKTRGQPSYFANEVPASALHTFHDIKVTADGDVFFLP
ncbi:hypothetical protein MHJ85_10260 [Brevibacterium ravenspurgense]|uniref:hypothetical protein n=1 Tax=Brevibacterium ravenspurgense TaxID=479117 RepID=UPI001EF2A50D|nr:hypothetical protein [Brevibacterium ravenspurgense]MCG7301633.1 hypothetical protein [Brevibacterium ravenspurgense]